MLSGFTVAGKQSANLSTVINCCALEKERWHLTGANPEPLTWTEPVLLALSKEFTLMVTISPIFEPVKQKGARLGGPPEPVQPVASQTHALCDKRSFREPSSRSTAGQGLGFRTNSTAR